MTYTTTQYSGYGYLTTLMLMLLHTARCCSPEHITIVRGFDGLLAAGISLGGAGIHWGLGGLLERLAGSGRKRSIMFRVLCLEATTTYMLIGSLFPEANSTKTD